MRPGTVLGFIGLGGMGSGMARNLQKAGYDMIVHDLREESARPLVELGATWAPDVATVGRGADVVFTSVPGPKEMRLVGTGPGGLLESMRPGTVWFDLTTNSHALLRETEAAAAEKGITLLDAPVSGGPKGAASGKLAVYVGGDRATFDAHAELFDAISDSVIYVGGIGAGTSAKLAHNCASFTTRLVIAEVFTLGVKAGVDPLELWHALRQGAVGRARMFDRIGDNYLRSVYDPASFTVDLADKDMKLVLEMAEDLGVPMQFAETAHAEYKAAQDRGWGQRDSRSPMQIQNERAGVELQLDPAAIAETLAR
jgi:3-hydroxyisobutyrate dehydrogenase